MQRLTRIDYFRNLHVISCMQEVMRNGNHYGRVQSAFQYHFRHDLYAGVPSLGSRSCAADLLLHIFKSLPQGFFAVLKLHFVKKSFIINCESILLYRIQKRQMSSRNCSFVLRRDFFLCFGDELALSTLLKHKTCADGKTKE